ncbi:MAG: protein phosphatase 2C domain-containing protein [Hyphomicrobiaceae bacterium]|nr:protein phosphatase 2C domain-containing protein [Hyphomicrobiaceae bacterium]
MGQPFSIRDAVSVAAGSVNEDRVGHAGDMAWVIDGATDILDAPLSPGPTDAAWIAETAHRLLPDLASRLGPAADLARLPALLCHQIARAFAKTSTRPPRERFEFPSATLLAVRITANRLDYVGVGDCALLLKGAERLTTLGVDLPSSGDKAVAAAVSGLQGETPDAPATDIRARLIPYLRSRREGLNRPGGYGILSIIPPPDDLVVSGSLPIRPGDDLLIATDGLIRLIEVYRRYDPAGLLASARERGLVALIADMRAIEDQDANCRRHPRAKAKDDASGVLIAVD